MPPEIEAMSVYRAFEQVQDGRHKRQGDLKVVFLLTLAREWASLSCQCGKLRPQGFSKVEDPGKGLVRVKGEAPNLASDVRDLVQIHQGEHHRVEHGQHLSHWWEADTTTIFP